MNTKYLPLRIVVSFIAAYHALVGLVLLFSGELSIKLAHSLAGMTITGTPELGIVGEILACYILAFAFVMGLAAYDPVKYRSAISIGIVLFVLRLFQRIFFAGKVMEVFQVPSGRYWMAFTIVAVLASALSFFRWRIFKDLKKDG